MRLVGKIALRDGHLFVVEAPLEDAHRVGVAIVADVLQRVPLEALDDRNGYYFSSRYQRVFVFIFSVVSHVYAEYDIFLAKMLFYFNALKLFGIFLSNAILEFTTIPHVIHVIM